MEFADDQGAGRCVGSGEGLFFGGLLLEKDREDNNRRSNELVTAWWLGQIDKNEAPAHKFTNRRVLWSETGQLVPTAKNLKLHLLM